MVAFAHRLSGVDVTGPDQHQRTCGKLLRLPVHGDAHASAGDQCQLIEIVHLWIDSGVDFMVKAVVHLTVRVNRPLGIDPVQHGQPSPLFLIRDQYTALF